MPLIQRYLFRQLLGPTLAITAALGGVAVLSQSLTLMNLMVSERQAAWTFIHLVLLSIPGLLAFVVPITAFVATLFVLNKLHTEQEIVVCFASGMSRWQVTSPAMRLAAYATLLMLVVNLWIAPACARVAGAARVKARPPRAGRRGKAGGVRGLVKAGEFSDSSKGLTVYAQDIDASGVLHNLFVYQPKPGGASATFDARTGIITHHNGVPVLVMGRGSNEQFNPQGTLNFLNFDEYVLDLTPYVDTDDVLSYKPSDMFLHELLFPVPTKLLTKPLRKKMMAEANARLASPLYIPSFVTFALLAVIGGSFNRLGYARQIGVAAVAALTVRLFGVTIQAACENAPWLNLLQYVVPIAPGWWAARRLFQQRSTAADSVQAFSDTLTPLTA